MNELMISGVVVAVLPEQNGTSKSGNVWVKQDYVIETPGQYPKKITFQVFGEEKIKQFGIQTGQDLDVSIDISASEWQGRWFNTVNAWKVALRNYKGSSQQFTQPQAQSQPATSFGADQGKDDLPF